MSLFRVFVFLFFLTALPVERELYNEIDSKTQLLRNNFFIRKIKNISSIRRGIEMKVEFNVLLLIGDKLIKIVLKLHLD